VVSFTPRQFYPRYPLDRRSGGPQSRSGRVCEDKESLPILRTEPQSSDPYPSQLTVTYLLTYLLTYSLHGAGYYLKS
jgi:hypothetical protein